jgi:enamine deaminase RidA (YjgF/YER057c/UK114 family)
MPGPTQDDVQNNPTESVQSKRIVTEGSADIFLHVMPASTRDDDRGQFDSMLARAYQAMNNEGITANNLVGGWLHFASTPDWSWREMLASAWSAPGPLPITGLVQPPAAPFCYCAMQLHAVRSARQSGVWHGTSATPAAATILRSGARHLRLMSIAPRPEVMRSPDLAGRAYDMLAQAGHALTGRGLSFRDVVRTWFHLRDMDSSYPALNRARSRFFAEQGIDRLPASTCLEAGFLDADTPIAMDLYAVSGGSDTSVRTILCDSMGEASAYGAAFARASLLDEPGRRTLYVSGTASIDRQGNVVAAGDLEGQLARMFENARGLLAQAGMQLSDTLSATAYLKHGEYLAVFRRAAARHGLLPQVPTTVLVADICRPEWLCEIELVAARNQG